MLRIDSVSVFKKCASLCGSPHQTQTANEYGSPSGDYPRLCLPNYICSAKRLSRYLKV